MKHFINSCNTLLWSIYVVWLWHIPTNTFAQCNMVSWQDSLDLVALYNSTNGNNWVQNDNWLQGAVDTWYGITLSNDGCFVREIILPNNQLDGNLPAFSALGQVEKLILAGNHLHNNFPSLASLTNLQEVYLAINQLEGNLPDFDVNPQLKVLDVAYNNLSGNLPDFANNLALEHIDCSGNQFTGNIPNYYQLEQLRRLKLPYNELTGSLPAFNNPLLEEINVGDNALSGEIPTLNLPNLLRYSLYTNHFTGNCPDLSLFPNLYKLSLVNNNLGGSLPDLSNNPNLNMVDVGHNQFEGIIPAHYANLLPQLTYLNLSENQLSGFLPNFSNPLLDSLLVSDNQLSGEIPNFQLPNLQKLQLCDNQFVGNIPNFSACPLLDTPIDLSCVTAARISGIAFADLNNNCQYDATEPSLPHVLVTLNNDEQYTFTDENGYYELLTNVGTDTIAVVATNNLWFNNCDSALLVNINDLSESLGNINFPLHPTTPCPLLLIDVSTARLRRCHSNTYTINYCNQGTQTAIDAYVQLFLPDNLSILTTSQAYTVVDGYYQFSLGDVGIGECGTIYVTDSVACDTPLGTGVCAEVFAFPNAPCFEASPLWDGSNLSSTAVCLGNEIQFSIVNNGLAMSDSSDYRIYEDDLVNVLSKIKLDEGEQIDLLVDANNATYRLVVEQTANNPNGTYVQTVVENCNNNSSLGFVVTQSENDLQPNYENDCHEVVGAYDPNDKVAVPTGIGEQHLLPKNEELTYSIRFQNTGTDTAYRVILVDTLDTQTLQIDALHVTAASHDYQLRIENGQILVVTFNNIMLPDSSTNRPASEGYISFKIPQRPNNPIRTRIENFADIYFDYNEAVRTPTIFHVIGEIAGTGLNSHTSNRHPYCLSPNPVDNKLLIINVDAMPADADIVVVNLWGQVQLRQSLQTLHSLVNTTSLPSGMYLYQISDANHQPLQTGKFVVLH